jgi:hypothetical protein
MTVRLRFLAIGIAVLFGFCAWKSCGQGLTLRDVAFSAGPGGGSSAQGGTSGGGGAPPSPDLFWEMDETSGDRVDEVEGLALTPVNGAFGTGPGYDTGLIGNAFRMLAANGSVNEPAALLENSAGSTDIHFTSGNTVSMAFWILAANTTGHTPRILLSFYDSMDNYLSELQWWYTGSEPADLQFYAYNDADSADSVLTLADHPERDGTWHFYACVYNGSTGKVKMSEDGGSFSEASDTATLVSAATGYLKFYPAFHNKEWRVDQVAVWFNHALTDAEVDWLHNSGSGRQYTDF